METWILPICMEGRSVQLIPIEQEHTKGLGEAASDGSLWKLWYTYIPSPENLANYVSKACEDCTTQKSLPFIIYHKQDQKIIGTSRYCNLDPTNKRLEIGYTWYGKSYQRTAVNTECKFLLLQHAFEELKCVAVEFRTHWHNHDSRNAILRLGAKQDGIIRNHRVDKDGCLRDSVVFSIINSEWPTVKKSLLFKMDKYETPLLQNTNKI